jgi:hypothetical protein
VEVGEYLVASCSHCAQRFKTHTLSPPTKQKIAALVDAVVLLRCFLRALPALAAAMAWAQTPLLRAARASFARPELAALLAEVEAVLEDEAQARGACVGGGRCVSAA